jgi:FkbM family methyltransferase
MKQEVYGFLDRKGGDDCHRVSGRLVKSIDEAAADPVWKACRVVVATFNPAAQMKPIVDALHQAGFSDVIDFFTFYQAQAVTLGDLYWLSTNPDLCRENTKRTANLRSMLADEKSKCLLDDIIHFRQSLDLTQIPTGEGEEHQYFPEDIPLPKQDVYFIDCGAFDGDTCGKLPSYFENVRGFDCFEPDADNYRAMINRLESVYPAKDLRKGYHQCGVLDSPTRLRFQPLGAGGRLSAEGDVTVECVRLDDVLPTHPPARPYLKMDIEGAELDALRGGARFIRDHAVDVAICVYHNPGHIWEAPEFLHSLRPDYRFYLRLYGENLFETVLYGIAP